MTRKSLRIVGCFLWGIAILIGCGELPIVTVQYFHGLWSPPPDRSFLLTSDIIESMDVCKNIFIELLKYPNRTSLVGNNSKAISFQPTATSFITSAGAASTVANYHPTLKLDLLLTFDSFFTFYLLFIRLNQTVQDCLAQIVANNQHNGTAVPFDANKVNFHVYDEGTSWCNYYVHAPHLEYTVVGFSFLCFIFMALCYGKIFREIYSNTNQNLPRHNIRKLVTTTFLLVGTFTIWYLPFIVYELSMTFSLRYGGEETLDYMGKNTHHFLIIHYFFHTMAVLSTLIQPVIYAGRLTIVKKFVLKFLLFTVFFYKFNKSTGKLFY